MTIATAVIRIWRRHRRHYLSVQELGRQPDLTVTEMLLLMQAAKQAGVKV